MSGAPVDLVWSAPSECPPRETVQAQVAKLTGEARASQPWRAIAIVERAADGLFELRLTMELDGHREERNLRATSCAELADATAVVLAVAVDGTRASETSPSPEAAPAPSEPSPAFVAATANPSAAPTPEPIATTPAATAARTQVAATAEAAPPPAKPRTPSSFSLAAMGTQSLGQFGVSAFGAGLAVAWRYGGMRVEVDAAWFPRSHVYGSSTGAEGDFGLWLAGLTGCWSPLRGPVALAGCAGGEAGRVEAEGSGSRVATAVAAQSPWVALKGGALLVWNVTPAIALRAGADAVFPLVRDTFYVGYVGDVYTPSPVAARWHGGAEVQFR
jgi:hypothetical protein